MTPAPTPVLAARVEGEALPELPAPESTDAPKRLRLPWLLLAALLLAGALTALLLL